MIPIQDICINLLIASLFGLPCKGQVLYSKDNEVQTISSDANSGNFIGIKNLHNYTLDIESTTLGNTAGSGSGGASSGNRLFFSGGMDGNLDDSQFQVTNIANSNKAVSQSNHAISGAQSVFRYISASNVTENTIAYGNEARILGRRGSDSPSAISGIETQANKINSSNFIVNGLALRNDATNSLAGPAVSGTDRAIRTVVDSKVDLNSTTYDNNANANNGRAVAGSVNSIVNVERSYIDQASIAIQNVATSEGGDAVSGVQNNIQNIHGNFSSDQGQQQATLFSNDVAVKNLAVSNDDGKAISGIQTSINNGTNALITLDAYTADNRAVTDGQGDASKDAIAGVHTNIINLESSVINLDVLSNYNQAFNYHKDPKNNSDAVSGFQLVIGQIDNSSGSINVNSTHNNAFALYGDAVSGSQINLINSNNSDNVDFNITVQNNTAESMHGNAISDSTILLDGQLI
eukprot:TRINITY_DN2943_c0_g1_i5.p1 TRINITY_DN2943_c0_g1~~TRINITY_DN2943_c0_g1_i5.p1  ORF type:complete len:519 (-),score=52.20 TRINITY_DN2943_c0_g1_i5:464-1852(-)